jgi:hypothetical protein
MFRINSAKKERKKERKKEGKKREIMKHISCPTQVYDKPYGFRDTERKYKKNYAVISQHEHRRINFNKSFILHVLALIHGNILETIVQRIGK